MAIPAPEDPPAHAPRRLPADPPYGLVEALPETVVAELVDGQLYAHPRPRGRHVAMSGRVMRSIGTAFDPDGDDPDGWWVLAEPELHLRVDRTVLVPDVAGWRRARMPTLPDDHRFTVPPDWVCELTSPSTESHDRAVKLPVYGQFGVASAWIVDVDREAIEALTWTEGVWKPAGTARRPDTVVLPPFDSRPLRPWLPPGA